jgi:hypothetical protein
LLVANKKLFSNKEEHASLLIIPNKGFSFEIKKKEDRANELFISIKNFLFKMKKRKSAQLN